MTPETCPTCGTCDDKRGTKVLGVWINCPDCQPAPETCPECESGKPTRKLLVARRAGGITRSVICDNPFHTQPERGDEGTQPAPDYTLWASSIMDDEDTFRAGARAALSAAKREGAERCGPTLQDFIDHLKAEFDAGNHKPWNAAAGPALNFRARWPATDEEKP